jgi:hypothetical protein
MNNAPIDKDLYEGFVIAVWQIINTESMYTGLDRFEGTDAHSIAKALRDVANEVIKDMEDEG